MLPGGVLSLHGYTTKWGFFDGVCRGAKHQPLELDKALVEVLIAESTAAAEKLEKEACELEVHTPGDPRAWVHERVRSPAWATTYVWTVRIVEHANAGGAFYTNDKDEATKVHDYGVRWEEGTDPVDAYVAHLNRKRAKDRRYMADQRRQYVTWQLGRIKNWKPKPLMKRSKP